MNRTVMGVVVALALAVQPMVALAMDADLSNDTTGSGSTNGNTVNHTGTTVISITNTGTATNDFDLDLNTGGNTVEGNTTVGDVTSGDINFDIVAETEINEGTVDLASVLTEDSTTITATNHNTGANSTNTNTTTTTDTRTVTETNTATVNNTVALNLNTGNNTVENNTTVGNVRSGDINGSIFFGNQLNQGGGDLPTPVTPVTPVTPATPVTPVTPQAAPTQLLPQGSGGSPMLIAQAAPVQQTTKTLFTERNEFFPAGSSLPSLAQLLGLALAAFALAGILDHAFQSLRTNRVQLYRFAYALPIL